jgi:hypothetical protein
MLRSLSSKGLLAASAIALLAHARDAAACGGGMFYDVSQQETVSVAGHAVVVSISKTRTVLWDRITYQGAPSDFAWIMPVAPGATLELASAAWIEAMLASTATTVNSPLTECYDDVSGGSSSGGCCGSAAGGDGANFGGGGPGGARGTETVTVVHREEIGPYTQETIKSDVPGAIATWLTDNGYAIPASVGPILDDYAAQGMEFLALRLKPGAGVTDMKPVRVIMSGPITTFPMRMLAAGARDTVPISLFVMAEGRYEAKGFSNATIRGSDLRWDFSAGKSDYPEVRAATLAAHGGATWLSAYAQKGRLLVSEEDPFSADLDAYVPPAIADQYVKRARDNGEATGSCVIDSPTLANSSGEVVELCDDPSMPCSTLSPGQIDSESFACDGIDDLARAMVGLHPRDVWVTRLDANLPVAALSQDLTLVPTTAQTEVSPYLEVQESTGDPCNAASASALKVPARHRRAAPVGVLVFGIGLAFMRKRGRRRRQ